MMRPFNALLVPILALVTLMSCSHSKGEKMSLLEGKPLFYLSIESHNIESLVELNGVYVHSVSSLSGQSKLDIPVNNYMHPLDNELAIALFPLEPGETHPSSAKLVVSLVVKSDDDSEVSFRVASILFDGAEQDLIALNGGNDVVRLDPDQNFSPSKNGLVTVRPVELATAEENGGSLRISRNVEIPNSLPLWKFFGSDELPDYYTIPDEDYYPDRNSLYKKYEKIQKALEVGDIDSILPFFEERNIETDKAFYLKEGTTENELKESLKRSVENGDLELVPLDKDFVDIKQEPNRKLVSLVRDDSGSAIGFNFAGGGGSVNYNLVFRRENGEWILTR